MLAADTSFFPAMPLTLHMSAQQSARERAALWLAVNKLDVLEAAKDAAIKDLQVRISQSRNDGRTRAMPSPKGPLTRSD